MVTILYWDTKETAAPKVPIAEVGKNGTLCQTEERAKKSQQKEESVRKKKVFVFRKSISWSSSEEPREEAEVLHIDDATVNSNKPFVLKNK